MPLGFAKVGVRYEPTGRVLQPTVSEGSAVELRAMLLLLHLRLWHKLSNSRCFLARPNHCLDHFAPTWGKI